MTHFYCFDLQKFAVLQAIVKIRESIFKHHLREFISILSNVLNYGHDMNVFLKTKTFETNKITLFDT